MFNIKKGNTSLDISYSKGKVKAKKAPDHLSCPTVNASVFIRSFEALATGYLKLNGGGDEEATLRTYLKNLGYTITELKPQTIRNELGEMITLYRLAH